MLLLSLALLVSGLALPAWSVSASTQHVTDCGDAGANTLRGKIGAAGAGDTIVFDQDCTIVLTTGTLTLTQNVTIDGMGHTVIVDGNNAATVFTVNDGLLATLNALTIQHGNAPNGLGGGIADLASPVTINLLTVTNSTITGNASDIGGGIINQGGTVTVTNTIAAVNTAPSGPDLTATFAIGGHNLIGTTSGATIPLTTGDIVNPTPLLGSLGSYGGPTQTIPLLPGSPAIDAGDDAVCASTTTPAGAAVSGKDRRGIARPSGTHCDIGAFESRGFTLTRTSSDNQSTPSSTAFAAPLVVTVASANSEPVQGGVVTFTGPTTSAGITSNPATATIGATTAGQARVTPTANGTTGANYSVTAGAAGTSPATVTFTLTNTASSLGLTAIAPSSGSTAGGASVTLSGTDFAAGATVSIGGVACTNVQMVNSMTLTCMTVNGQNVTLPGGYTYGVASPLPGAKTPGPGGGAPSAQPGARPSGTAVGPAPNSLPASRP
jgi:hypothetical protein